jgi:carboxyl-terminal processing protease
MLLTAVAMTACGRSLSPEPYYDTICKNLARSLPRNHLLHLEMGDMVSSRAWTNLIHELDFDRMFFLQGDIDGFRQRELQLDDDLRAGNMQFGFEVAEVFKERFSNRVDFIGQLLSEGFDWTQEETYAWDRKTAVWAGSEAEWNDNWRRKIKNEYLRMMLGREAEAAAATNAVVTNAVAATDVLLDATVEPTNSASVLQVEWAGAGAVTDTGVVAVASVVATPTNVVLPSIESVMSNRYHQALMVIEDSDPEWVLQRYMNAFSQAYDPHTSYFTPSALEDFQIEMNLALFGIGALLSAEDGAAKIVSLIAGGPAERDESEKRLQPGDKIIAVAQDDQAPVDVLHWPLNKIVKLIRGEKGTRVVLTVIPVSDPSGTLTKTVDLIRDEVKLEERAASGEMHTVEREGDAVKLGVIKLPAFYGSMQVRSPDEPGFRSAVYDVLAIIKEQKAAGVDGIILDLRSNGGGALVEAVDMTGLFIRRGPTVQVKERLRLRSLSDEDPRVFYEGPLIVLVNRLSASASEILAGALQDYGRAVIVGDSKTHGKGTVQSVLDMGVIRGDKTLGEKDQNIGSLKVTTASYIRISGASTQKQGVQPDIVVPSPWDFMETGEEFLPNAIPESQELPARYSPVADLSNLVPLLRERSETRRRESPEFQAYARLLERLAQMQDEKELSLNLEKRRVLAESERELAALQERLAAVQGDAGTEEGGEDPGKGEKKVEPDPVMKETLQILADWVRVERGELPAVDEPEVAGWQRMTP